MDIFLF